MTRHNRHLNSATDRSVERSAGGVAGPRPGDTGLLGHDGVAPRQRQWPPQWPDAELLERNKHRARAMTISQDVPAQW